MFFPFGPSRLSGCFLVNPFIIVFMHCLTHQFSATTFSQLSARLAFVLGSVFDIRS